MSSMWSIAFTLFLLINAPGMAPAILVLIKDLPPQRQHFIILRECVIALIFIFIFYFIGDQFFKWLRVEQASIQISGGLILFLIALRMIFPSLRSQDENTPSKAEPYIVPIATPLIAGPAVLATVMIQARNQIGIGIMMGAILLAWIVSLAILQLSPFIKKIIGTKGFNALERLMGLVLILLSMQMLLKGIYNFIISNFHSTT